MIICIDERSEEIRVAGGERERAALRDALLHRPRPCIVKCRLVLMPGDGGEGLVERDAGAQAHRERAREARHGGLQQDRPEERDAQRLAAPGSRPRVRRPSDARRE